MFPVLILLVTIYIILTSEVTSLSLLFCALVMMVYIVPYFTLWDTFKKLFLVADKGGEDFFAFIFFNFIFFLIGTKLCRTKVSRDLPSQPKTIINYRKYETYSIIVGLIGIAGYGYFIKRSGPSYFYGHNSGDFTVGGPIYELRYFVFASVLLLFQAYLSKTLSKKGTIFLLAISAFLAFDAYVQQQRGSWIRFGVIILLSYVFHENSLKKIRLTTLIAKYKRLFLLGVIFAFLLSFTVQMRQFYSPQTSFIYQVSATLDHIFNSPDLIVGGSGIDHGNETVTAYNAYRAEKVAKTYDYGYKWLYVFIHFIPRQLWDEKPTWFTFSNDVFTTMDRYVVYGHAFGSAETGMIDAFYRFRYFTPVFFLLLGLYTQWLHVKAKSNLHSQIFYTCFFVGFFYSITQNIVPMVVFTSYMYIPAWVVLKTTSRKLNNA